MADNKAFVGEDTPDSPPTKGEEIKEHTTQVDSGGQTTQVLQVESGEHTTQGDSEEQTTQAQAGNKAGDKAPSSTDSPQVAPVVSEPRLTSDLDESRHGAESPLPSQVAYNANM